MSSPHLTPGFLGAPDSLSARAYRFAQGAHRGVLRKVDGAPFINHPCRVAACLHHCDEDELTVAAAFLHDTVEDTDVTLKEIRREFGDELAELVDALSEDKRIPTYDERKRQALLKLQRAGRSAVVLFLADKLVNFQDFLTSYEVECEALDGRFNAPLDEKVKLSERQLRFISARLPGGHPLLDELNVVHARFLALRERELARTR